MNKEDFYRQALWKTKRLLEDYLKWDNTIDHYVINEEKYQRITNHINKALQVKAIDQRRRKYE